MRLIDADKLVKAIENENPGMSISGAIEKFARTAQVNMQPTVDAIPIELYEQVKGERDVAIEQLKALNIELFEKPYLKAIPIEWIKDYMLKLPDGSEAYECILVMLEEWKRDFGTEEDPYELLEKLSDILSVFPKLQGLVMDVLEEKKND